ncbi:MAG: hypothetical protein AAFX93_11040 [Verrucomicrobiota bacterium]
MQKFIHWLEEGRGGAVFRYVGATLFIVVFSIYLSGKRYTGPGGEVVMDQAVLARSLADGQGFTTGVWRPQPVALMEERHGWTPDGEERLPELYSAPAYSVVLGAVLGVLPVDLRSWLESDPENSYYRADFFLLGVNLLLFWINLALVALIANLLFNTRAAWLAGTGYLLSAGVWGGVLGVNGNVLLSFFILLIVIVGVAVERIRQPGISLLWPVLAGSLCGLLFLTDYPAGLALIPTLAYFAWRRIVSDESPNWRLGGIWGALMLVAFSVTIAPWLWRNIDLTGNPLGLAAQEIAWRADDPTAEPAIVRSTFTAEMTAISWRKLINKGLDGIGASLSEGLWEGGGFLFVGFFLAALFYRFKRSETDALRWYSLAMIAVLTFGAPFLDSAEAPLLPGVWLAPLFIIFGAGFFFILMESAGDYSVWSKRGWVAGVVLLQALPLIHWILQPGVRAHFSFPPYAPIVFRSIEQDIAKKFYPGYGLMSDSPAGQCWYGGGNVWGQPTLMGDFAQIVDRQPIGALVLTPTRLDRPFYTQLLKADHNTAGRDAARAYGWGAVYHGLASGSLPSFFPLQKPMKIWDNVYVCLDPLARRPGSD